MHGLGTNLASWDLVAPLLRHRFRLVSMDLPGHGRSTAPESYSFDGDVEVVDAVRSMLELQTPAVVGHSYGGMLAVALAADPSGRCRVAVNIDGVGFAHPLTPPELIKAWATDEEPWPDVGDQDWMQAESDADRDELAAAGVAADLVPPELIRRGFGPTADGRWRRAPAASYYLAVARAISEVDLLRCYARATCPTVTVLATRRDDPDPELAAAAHGHVEGLRTELLAIPSARVESLAGGHYGFLEQPERAAALLDASC